MGRLRGRTPIIRVTATAIATIAQIARRMAMKPSASHPLPDSDSAVLLNPPTLLLTLTEYQLRNSEMNRTRPAPPAIRSPKRALEVSKVGDPTVRSPIVAMRYGATLYGTPV